MSLSKFYTRNGTLKGLKSVFFIKAIPNKNKVEKSFAQENNTQIQNLRRIQFIAELTYINMIQFHACSSKLLKWPQ